MPNIPDYVSVQCPDCLDDIWCDLDVAPMPGTNGARMMAWVRDLAGPVARHFKEAGHVDEAADVSVRVLSLSSN